MSDDYIEIHLLTGETFRAPLERMQRTTSSIVLNGEDTKREFPIHAVAYVSRPRREEEEEIIVEEVEDEQGD